MLEVECKIRSADAVLAGTLTLPDADGRFPCVLMLPASGPVDRDENAKGQRLEIFNTVAHHLAREGYASLRYDKRGCGKSSGWYLKTGYFEFVQDAVAWFDWLRIHERCEAEVIHALGHSEGTLTAMHLSLQRPSIAGIIQLCPTVEDVESALHKQAQHVRDALRVLPGLKGVAYRAISRLGGDPAALVKQIDRVRRNQARPREVESKHIGLKWLREMLQLDVRQLYAQMQCPMLLIAGTKDVQCDPTSVPGIPQIAPAPVEVHVVPNLTHILRLDEGEPSIFRYRELMTRPVAQSVLDLIARWLKRQPRRREGTAAA